MRIKTGSFQRAIVPALKGREPMKTFATLMSICLLAGLFPAQAEEASLSFGGDQFAAGQVSSIATPVQHDAFVVGNDVTLSGVVSGDAHLAGFNVHASADVTGDLYAAGFSVTGTAGVGGDVTAAGNTVTLRSASPVSGNVRLAGGTVILAAPVAGSALITARDFTLDQTIAGDLSFYGEALTFGPTAKVGGTLSIRAPSQIAVPQSVASPDRVHFEQLNSPDYVSEAGKSAGGVLDRFWPVFLTVVAWWALLFIVGTLCITLLPKTLAGLELASQKRPFRNMGLGILVFATVLGLVPVLAMTVVGILLLPIAILFAVLAASLAYLTGGFLIALRVANAVTPIDTNLKRLGVLAVTLIAVALLGMLPFIGWLLTLVLLVFGFGVIASMLEQRRIAPENNAFPTGKASSVGV
jgi:hypothetical protein